MPQGRRDQAPFDHPILVESLARIRRWLGPTGLAGVEQEVLERIVHSSGDPALAAALRFSPGACRSGMAALAGGAPIVTDTAMAAAAVAPMARRTFANPVINVLAPGQPRLGATPPSAPTGHPTGQGLPPAATRTAEGMEAALRRLGSRGAAARECPPRGAAGREQGSGVVVLIGSAPTALERLLTLVAAGSVPPPALVIGMPVGFVGVAESKRNLARSGLPQILLEGSRGGAGVAAATVNALLRRAWLDSSG